MKIVSTPGELSSRILVSECMHESKGRSVVYRGLHQSTNTLMAIKLVEVRANERLIMAHIANLFLFYRRKHSFHTIAQLPTHILQVAKLTNTYFICRAFIPGHTLKHLIASQSQFCHEANIIQVAKSMVSMVSSFGGINNYLLTSGNMMVSEVGQLELNPTSLEGLLFLHSQAYIRKHQFVELYPYLDSRILEREPKNRCNAWLKIRCLVVNLLKIVLREEFNLISGQIKQSSLNARNHHVATLIRQVPTRYRQLLQQKTVANQIKHYSTCGIQLGKLFQQILVEEKPMSFGQLIHYLHKDQFSKLENDMMFYTCHKALWEKEQLKECYIKRGLDELQTYIPVKFGRQLIHVLHYPTWYQCIAQNNTSVKNIVYSLLHHIPQLYSHNNQPIKTPQKSIYHFLTKYVKQTRLKFSFIGQDKKDYKFSRNVEFSWI